MSRDAITASWKRQAESKEKIASMADTSVMDEDGYFFTQRLNNDKSRHLWLLDMFDCMTIGEGKLWAATPRRACDGFSCAGRLIHAITNDEELSKNICAVICEGIDHISASGETTTDGSEENVEKGTNGGMEENVEERTDSSLEFEGTLAILEGDVDMSAEEEHTEDQGDEQNVVDEENGGHGTTSDETDEGKI